MVRLISGGAELLLGRILMWGGGRNIAVGFGKRYCQVGHIEWKAMTRNMGNRWIYPLSQPARGYAKLEGHFFEN